MKLIRMLTAAGVSAGLVSLTSSASATPYTIDFTATGWSAVGQVDVTGGVATSGFLDVTTGATTVDYDYLAIGSTASVVQDNNGDNLPYGDNVVNVGDTDPFTVNGLLFLTAPVVAGFPDHVAGAGIYLSADGAGGPVNLNGYGNAPGFGWGVPNVDGTVTLTEVVGVPDNSSTASLLGMSFAAMAGGVVMQRRLVGRSMITTT